MTICPINIDTWLSDILLSPRYRIYRHLLLIVVMTVISVYIVINHPAALHNTYYTLIGITGYTLVILAASYTNIYGLVPRLLLRDKPFYYFLSVVLLAFFSLFLLAILQLAIFNLYDMIETIGWLFATINILSSIILLGLMMAGITTFMLLKHWNLSAQRIGQLQEAGIQSELTFLKKQINPHFLFNVINNANVLLKDRQGGASSILFKLEDLLRYQINESAREEIALTSDIDFLTDYLNLEKVRRDRFEFSITVNGSPGHVRLPPLLFIPFVENAVKFSQDSDKASYVHILFTIDDHSLYFRCENSIPEDGIRPHATGGLGLKNICRRLALLYPGAHTLHPMQEIDKYSVDLHLKLSTQK